jgi:WW domain-containing oxidoreductase
MNKSLPFGARSTADQVLAGIDLTGKRYVVTGCNSGLGFETMNALAANGAEVFGLARTLLSATLACSAAGPSCVPVVCDLEDLDSVAAAAARIRRLTPSLDAIIANAGIANLGALQVRHGVERQFLINHIAHFALINALVDRLRDGSGRVVVSSRSVETRVPTPGFIFGNLDGRHLYDSAAFYAQSKWANAVYAKELARRLGGRGICVNSLDPGATRGTKLHRSASPAQRWLLALRRLFWKSPAQGAATQSLLAASPLVNGISGEFWSDCKMSKGADWLGDPQLAARLWESSQAIIDGHTASAAPLQLAA